MKEVRDSTAKTKPSKSFGKDNISCYFLKLALHLVEVSLACLFNTSFETSMLPDLLNLARVTPIFEERDKAVKSNYRLNPVLPIISRIFEKLVVKQLCQHMNDNA